MGPGSLNRRRISRQRLDIYNGRFSQNVKTVTGIGPVYEPTIKFYILADEFLMSQAVKTATLEAFVKARTLSSLPMNAEIEFVLNRIANDCPMRSWLSTRSVEISWAIRTAAGTGSSPVSRTRHSSKLWNWLWPSRVPPLISGKQGTIKTYWQRYRRQ
jgi:hypothetical protein